MFSMTFSSATSSREETRLRKYIRSGVCYETLPFAKPQQWQH
uniref:Uncharacterized protein n=1 Tax=Octopus bimaculoides TaxID=37653 RepID=A0A0L8GTQ8_OCTBM